MFSFKYVKLGKYKIRRPLWPSPIREPWEWERFEADGSWARDDPDVEYEMMAVSRRF